MKKTKIESFNTKSKNLKVAVISDTQLPPTLKGLENDDIYLRHLKNALTVIKNENVDMILFAGDIADLGTRFAFQSYADAIDEIFGNNKPIVQTIMGNHDYWSKDLFTAINHRKAFRQIIGHSPWTHYVVNGYHFIGASPNTGSMQKGYKYTAKWLDNHLKKAEKDSEDKPIFVVTHNQPLDTCYGSDEWGDVTLGAVLSKYPNVINLSGHTHYSILDERSVWQGDYTVISTQSLSYTELETGKENGTIPPNADATPMGYIIEFSDDRFAFRRINFAVSEFCKEEKADAPWVFPLPYKNDGRYSYEKRKPLNKPPVITNTDATAHIDGKNVILSFNAAQDDDFVHSYKVIIDDRETKYFFSDFYNGIDNMKKTVEIKLKKPTGKAKHTYKIFAVDSWGEESKNFINIETE